MKNLLYRLMFTPSKPIADYEFDIKIENSQNQEVAFSKYLFVLLLMKILNGHGRLNRSMKSS
jgi:hypothetical protein